MTDDRGVLRGIAWREIFPWLMILRTFRTAVAPSVLLAAAAGTLVTPLARYVGAYVFLNADDREAMRTFASIDGYPPAPPPGASIATQVPQAIEGYLPHVPSAIEEAYFGYVEPFWRLFHLDLPLRHAAFYVFVSLWTIAVWAFFGGIITRLAVNRLGPQQNPNGRETVTFVARRYLQYFFAPLYPLLGIAVIVLLMIPLGLLMRLDVGVVLAGIVWIVVVLLGLIAAWLLIGLLFGWPLMWPAISSERDGDAFDAFSRSYAYVYGKPLHYLFYVIVAALFGTLCWALVHYGATMVVEFGFWAASWGSGGERMQVIRELAHRAPWHIGSGERFGTLEAGAALISTSLLLVRLLVTAFTFAFFWVNASAIYLLLRSDVDGKEVDEVYQLDEENRFAAGRRAIAETPSAPATSTPAEDAAREDTAE